RDVRYDPDHRRFYFKAINIGQPRTIQYKSVGGRRVMRQVVWQPVRRSTGEARNFWWHVAAGLRFHHVSPLQWCMSIRPEWHLTSDDERPCLLSESADGSHRRSHECTTFNISRR